VFLYYTRTHEHDNLSITQSPQTHTRAHTHINTHAHIDTRTHTLTHTLAMAGRIQQHLAALDTSGPGVKVCCSKLQYVAVWCGAVSCCSVKTQWSEECAFSPHHNHSLALARACVLSLARAPTRPPAHVRSLSRVRTCPPTHCLSFSTCAYTSYLFVYVFVCMDESCHACMDESCHVCMDESYHVRINASCHVCMHQACHMLMNEACHMCIDESCHTRV